LRYKYQDSSATVTNPGLTPVETNAKLAGYHQVLNPSNLKAQNRVQRLAENSVAALRYQIAQNGAGADTPAPPVSTFNRAIYY
jgi:hypothetical protein